MPDAIATDLLFRPALELGSLVRAGEVTSRELVEAALARIEALNPSVNAFIHVDAEAAVAAGMVPLAHGADGGGSIRIPAACCGLVGLKATRHRISRGPDVGEHWLSIGGVLSRTVADTAAALDAIEGYEVGDAAWLDSPAEPFARATERDPGRLRIGLSLESPVDTELDPQYEGATREAAELLSSLGHEVEE